MKTKEEQFASCFSLIDDAHAKEVAKRYLGDDAPSSRSAVCEALGRFLLSPPVAERSAGMLSEKELSLILLVTLFPSLTVEDIARTSVGLSGEATLLCLSDLYDRMILLPSAANRLTLNPLFDSATRPLLSLSSLFGPKGPDARAGFVAASSMLRGYLSLVEGRGRIRAEGEMPSIFPRARPSLFPLLSRSLSSLGIVKGRSVDHEKARRLLSHSDIAIASLFASLSFSLPFSVVLDCATLLTRLSSVDHDHFSLLSSLLGADESSLLESLLTWSLAEDDGHFVIARNGERSERAPLLVDSDNTITVTGREKEGDILHRFATLEKMDEVSIWTVDRNSLYRAFDSGLSEEEILRYLASESKNGTLALEREISLTAENYRSLSLTRAIAITADCRLSRLLSSLPTLSPFILSHPSSEVFLMDEQRFGEWAPLLEEAIGMLPAVRGGKGEEKRKDEGKSEELPTMEESPFASLTVEREREAKKVVMDSALRSLIEKEESEGKRALLLELFHAKRLISPLQLSLPHHSPPPAACGFDYQGKLRFLKEVMKRKKPSLLLVETDEEKYEVIALSLEKTADGKVLLRCERPGDGKTLMIPVGKLFSVKVLAVSLL